MLSNLLMRLLLLVARKEDIEMLAFLWANQIILGKKKYSQVPAKLKEQVKEILIDAGCEDLINN